MRVVARRGDVVEAEHPVAAVLVADGVIREAVGPVDRPVTWRSAAKPFQLEVALPLSGLEASDRWLAVGASSHWGQPVHVGLVEEILRAGGIDERALRCGADWPSHPAAKVAALRSGDSPRAVWNNCSGKHAFMACACHAQGWDPDYRPPDHPLQGAIARRVAERTGHPVHAVVDGCGIPCFVLPIGAMARAWAGLATEARDGATRLGRIARAMAAHPVEAGGEGAVDSAIMAGATAPVVAKVGAEGLINVAVPQAGAAVVVKVWSGNDAARAVALGALLDRWFPGLVPPEVLARYGEVRNVVGQVVGGRALV
jgi:L-asparaginase II